jgi:4-amino-4-deoxy-L-arabinose transferase-like glycosyltransferase
MKAPAQSQNPTSASSWERPPFAAGPVLAIAGATTALLLVFAGRYGYHRDELYFLAASRHLAFGYVDQPPVGVLVAWIDRVALGNTLLGLRVIPAILDGGVVALTGAMARELGGRRFAQGFGALCVAVGGFLVIGHIEGPTIYDAFDWALVSLLVIRILRTGEDRFWLAVGLTAGIGLEAKETILLLLGGLAVGLLLNRQASVVRSPWLWAGAVLALALWMPNLLWEATHGWPARQMDASLRAEHSGLGYAVKYPFLAILVVVPVLAPVWMAGWWALWREPRLRPYRAFAVAFALLFIALWVVIPDRFYYLAPLYPVLFAAGAIVTQDVVRGSSGFFRRRPARRPLLWRSRRTAVAIAVAGGLVLLPVTLPVLPPAALATVPVQKINYNLGEEIGWPDFIAEVASVWRSLPAEERRSAVILTGNYGEAGAIDRFGGAVGLPGAYSGHNSFWWWGPPRPSMGTTVAIEFDRAALTPYFDSVILATRIHNRYGVSNDEDGVPVWVCTGQRAPWPRIWPRFKNYG